MVRVQAYTDGPDEVHDRQREYQMARFKTAALPFYAIIDPHTDTVLATFESLASSVDDYVAFLDKGLSKFTPAATAPEGGSAETAPPEAASDAGVDHGPDGGMAASGVSTALRPDGEPVDLRFPDMKTGKPFELSSLRGQWVLVNLWASWCAPCKKELLGDFPQALAGAPHVKLVTIAFEDEDTVASAVKFADEANLWKHIALLGPDDVEESGLAAIFEASNALPITYLIHPKGHIAWTVKGSVHKELLAQLLAQTR
jgi:thiol-disulfide isomerase/thioredoxin